jgi:histone acetyltransferase (RNA polymerase elongator complex component)
VQLGVQHTDEGVIAKINRDCTKAEVANAIRRLKNSCFKVDIHLMPNLPGGSVALDEAMFEEVLQSPDLQVMARLLGLLVLLVLVLLVLVLLVLLLVLLLQVSLLLLLRSLCMHRLMQADQWKIYPCEIVPWTVIKKWHDEGKFTPYPDDELVELLMRVKAKVHPWIRLNR